MAVLDAWQLETALFPCKESRNVAVENLLWSSI